MGLQFPLWPPGVAVPHGTAVPYAATGWRCSLWGSMGVAVPYGLPIPYGVAVPPAATGGRCSLCGQWESLFSMGRIENCNPPRGHRVALFPTQPTGVTVPYGAALPSVTNEGCSSPCGHQVALSSMGFLFPTSCSSPRGHHVALFPTQPMEVTVFNGVTLPSVTNGGCSSPCGHRVALSATRRDGRSFSPWTLSVPTSDGSSAAPTRSQQRYRPASLRRTARSLRGALHTQLTLLARSPPPTSPQRLRSHRTPIAHPLHTVCRPRCTPIAHPLPNRYTPTARSLHTQSSPLAHPLHAHYSPLPPPFHTLSMPFPPHRPPLPPPCTPVAHPFLPHTHPSPPGLPLPPLTPPYPPEHTAAPPLPPPLPPTPHYPPLPPITHPLSPPPPPLPT